MNATAFYDALSLDYDRFVDWRQRLAYELPLLEEILRSHQAHNVMDAACGTGKHALALTHLGMQTSGADISAQMIARARENAAQAGIRADFYVAGFGQLVERVAQRFDAILCLGNSLPHLLTPEDLHNTLLDWRASLEPGGILILQMRNLERVLRTQQRFMPPQTLTDQQGEWVFERFYDWLPDSQLSFNMLRWNRLPGSDWLLEANATTLRAWTLQELTSQISETGLVVTQTLGNLSGADYEPDASGDLVLLAQK